MNNITDSAKVSLGCAIISCLFLLMMIGCYRYQVHPYSPSILKEGEGRIAVGKFVYIPYEQGKLKDNQVDTDTYNTTIYTDSKMVDHVKNAVSSELKLMGYRLDPEAQKMISGDIMEYSCKMIGTSYDVLVRIKFTIKEITEGDWKEVYVNNSSGSFSQNKFRLSFEPLSISAILNEGLKNCLNNFISDAQSRRIL